MSRSIADFNKDLSRSRVCGDCPMSGRTFVGADSWNGEIGHVDVLFLGLNPGAEEARKGLPFVGPSGMFLRSALNIDNVSWGIINSILCFSENESKIVNSGKSRACCRKNVARVWLEFTPDIIVPCGNGPSSVFEIPDGITIAERNYYISRGRNHTGKPTLVMPIQHPSALIRSGGRSSSKYSGWSTRIINIFQMAKALKNYKCPEDMMADRKIPWQGLFGY